MKSSMNTCTSLLPHERLSPLECGSRCAEVVVPCSELLMKTIVDECGGLRLDEGVGFAAV